LAVLLVSVQCVACTPEPEPVNDIGRWQITDSFILSAALSKQGQHTALLFPQGRLAVWDNNTQKRLVDWHAPEVLPDTSMMHMGESARYLLSATRTVVQIWDATSAAPAGSFDLSAQLDDASITSLRFILAPHSFVVGTSGGDILFADTRSDEYHLAHQHDADVVKLIMSPDGELYSAGNDGLVVRWDKQHKAPEQTLTVPHRVTSLEVGPDDKVFVSDALETQIIWQSQRNEIISELTYWDRFQWFRVARFAPINQWIITSSPKTELYIWHLANGEPAAQWRAEVQGVGSAILDMRFTNPATLRTITSDGVLQDWDLTQFENH
ncbi:MAG: WD40 repeat domain-containing protein, partial [Aestuariibacter sp.]|nr:WD40 repeat domain-containing protein [Aestuariibacter sp.]MCP5011071.1 WD40 repeat domain-containing protein [Aestuariibacter sp.]